MKIFDNNVVLWWIPILVFTSIVVFYSYYQTFLSNSQFNALVVYNLSTEEISVGESKLNTLDAAIILLNEDETEVNVEGSILTVPSQNQFESSINLKIISDIRYCFFSANVTNSYLGNGNSEVLKIYDSEANFQSIQIEPSRYEYLFPGYYNLNNLGRISISKDLIGIYAVECSKKSDIEHLNNLIDIYRRLIPKQQRELIDSI